MTHASLGAKSAVRAGAKDNGQRPAHDNALPGAILMLGGSKLHLERQSLVQ
jgi:hypothetical protein